MQCYAYHASFLLRFCEITSPYKGASGYPSKSCFEFEMSTYPFNIWSHICVTVEHLDTISTAEPDDVSFSADSHQTKKLSIRKGYIDGEFRNSSMWKAYILKLEVSLLSNVQYFHIVFLILGEIQIENSIDFSEVHSDHYFLLGQDADGIMGKFDANQAFSGKLTQVNVWNFALTPAEVQQSFEDCGQDKYPAGNVVSWNKQEWEYSNITTTQEDMCDDLSNNTVVIGRHTMSFFDAHILCDALGGKLPHKLDKEQSLEDTMMIYWNRAYSSQTGCHSPAKPFWTGLLPKNKMSGNRNSTYYSLYSDYCKCNSTAHKYNINMVAKASSSGGKGPICVGSSWWWTDETWLGYYSQVFEENCNSKHLCAICLVPRSAAFYLKGLCQDLTSEMNGYFDTTYYLAGVRNDTPIFK